MKKTSEIIRIPRETKGFIVDQFLQFGQKTNMPALFLWLDEEISEVLEALEQSSDPVDHNQRAIEELSDVTGVLYMLHSLYCRDSFPQALSLEERKPPLTIFSEWIKSSSKHTPDKIDFIFELIDKHFPHIIVNFTLKKGPKRLIFVLLAHHVPSEFRKDIFYTKPSRV